MSQKRFGVGAVHRKFRKERRTDKGLAEASRASLSLLLVLPVEPSLRWCFPAPDAVGAPRLVLRARLSKLVLGDVWNVPEDTPDAALSVEDVLVVWRTGIGAGPSLAAAAAAKPSESRLVTASDCCFRSY